MFASVKEQKEAAASQKDELIPPDTIIFISNTQKDGFQEGDGDLMDKLTLSLNQKKWKTIRIIESIDNIPEDRRAMVCEKGAYDKPIIALEAASEKAPAQVSHSLEDQMIAKNDIIRALQHQFLTIVSAAPYTNKIVYIGSRISAYLSRSGEVIFSESGSIFTKPFIQALKDNGVKIVVCCLEFKFFKRSISELKNAFYMLDHQLFLADKIHFLTQPDKEEFEKTLAQLKINPKLQLVEEAAAFPLSHDEREQHDKLVFNELINDEIHRSKGEFISGIFTVTPLTTEDIINFGNQLKIPGSNHLEILQNRECNVLQFGILRGEKGIDESLTLAQEFKKQSLPLKVLLVGKLLNNFKMAKHIFFTLIPQVNARKFKSLLLQYINNHNIRTVENKIVTRKDLEKDTFLNNQVFNKNQLSFNAFFQDFFDELSRSEEYRSNFSNVELYFNASEQKLKELAMRCKYAVKFDHKGMANNASTIVSCLGLYLPIFTTYGLVTNREFINFEMPSESPNLPATLEIASDYKKAIIMKNLGFSKGNDVIEIKPINPSLQEVIDFILKDDKDNYQLRLLALEKLHQDRIFDCDHVVENLIAHVFNPLHQALSLSLTTSSTSSQSSSTPSLRG